MVANNLNTNKGSHLIYNRDKSKSLTEKCFDSKKELL